MLVAIIVFLVVKDTQAGNMPLYRSFTDAKEKGSCTSIVYSPARRSQRPIVLVVKYIQAGNMPLCRPFTDAKEKL